VSVPIPIVNQPDRRPTAMPARFNAGRGALAQQIFLMALQFNVDDRQLATVVGF